LIKTERKRKIRSDPSALGDVTNLMIPQRFRRLKVTYNISQVIQVHLGSRTTATASSSSAGTAPASIPESGSGVVQATSSIANSSPAPVPELTDLDTQSSSKLQIDPQTVKVTLWDRAYRELGKNNKELVEKYEILLSKKLDGKGI
jgi:hypothetical protein